MHIINQIRLEQESLSHKIDNVLALIDIEETKNPTDDKKINNLYCQLEVWYNRIQLEERNAKKIEEKYGKFLNSGTESTTYHH